MCQFTGTPIPCPSPPTPATVLTCQGQLWGTALSPPTTRVTRLGWKVGTPQLEAGGDRRGSTQVSGLASLLGKGRVELRGWVDMDSDFTG